MLSLGSSKSGKIGYIETVKAGFCCLITTMFKRQHGLKKKKKRKRVLGEDPDKHEEIQPHTYSSTVCAKA